MFKESRNKMKKILYISLLITIYIYFLCSCVGEKLKGSSPKDSIFETHHNNGLVSLLNDTVVVEESMYKDSIIASVKKVELIDTIYENEIKNQIIPFLIKNHYSKDNIIGMHFYFKYDCSFVSFYPQSYIGSISYIKKSVLCYFDVEDYHFIVCDDLNLSTKQKQSLFYPTSQTRQFVLSKKLVIKHDGGPEWVYILDNNLTIQPFIITEEW